MAFINQLTSGQLRDKRVPANVPKSSPKPGYTGPQGETGAHAFSTPLKQMAPLSYQPMERIQSIDDGDNVTPYQQNNAPVDPYASTVFGSTANFNRVRGDWMGQKDATFKSIQDRIGRDYDAFNSSVLDFDNDVQHGQSKINNMYVQNELAGVQGKRGVLDMVGTGVKSAGITLANRPGASTSSATDGVARAYGEIGQKEMTKVGNQYALGKGEVDMAQADFLNEIGVDVRHLKENKNRIVNDIASEAAQKVAALNAAAAGASLEDRLNIESEKERVRNEAMGKLSTLDGAIASAESKAKPSSQKDWMQKATEMANAGVAGADQFNYTSQTPTQFSGSGPFAGELPIFTAPKKNNEQ
jgi:hypothetical protein